LLEKLIAAWLALGLVLFGTLAVIGLAIWPDRFLKEWGIQ
jgi:hypothetical protein